MNEPRGPEAARLRQKRFELLQHLAIPEDALPGSLALTHRRCGKPTCHCAKDKGHPGWSLTFMQEGRKRVERIPADWVEEVRRRVDLGQRLKEEIAQVLTSNAQLLVLARKQAK